MISKTAYSSQTKLIGEGLLIGGHGIGYSNLAFEAKKGQKRPIFSFKPLKRLQGLEFRVRQGHRRLSKSGWAISLHLFWSIPIPTPKKNKKCFENLSEFIGFFKFKFRIIQICTKISSKKLGGQLPTLPPELLRPCNKCF